MVGGAEASDRAGGCMQATSSPEAQLSWHPYWCTDSERMLSCISVASDPTLHVGGSCAQPWQVACRSCSTSAANHAQALPGCRPTCRLSDHVDQLTSCWLAYMTQTDRRAGGLGHHALSSALQPARTSSPRREAAGSKLKASRRRF